MTDEAALGSGLAAIITLQLLARYPYVNSDTPLQEEYQQPEHYYTRNDIGDGRIPGKEVGYGIGDGDEHIGRLDREIELGSCHNANLRPTPSSCGNRVRLNVGQIIPGLSL